MTWGVVFPFRRPFRADGLLYRNRWLAPPANFHQPSGIQRGDYFRLRKAIYTLPGKAVFCVLIGVEMNLIIREAKPETDWLTGIWPIFQEVVRAGDTLCLPAGYR